MLGFGGCERCLVLDSLHQSDILRPHSGVPELNLFFDNKHGVARVPPA